MISVTAAHGRNVVSDGALEIADPVELLADIEDVEVEVLAADEVHVVRQAAPRPT